MVGSVGVVVTRFAPSSARHLEQDGDHRRSAPRRFETCRILDPGSAATSLVAPGGRELVGIEISITSPDPLTSSSSASGPLNSIVLAGPGLLDHSDGPRSCRRSRPSRSKLSCVHQQLRHFISAGHPVSGSSPSRARVGCTAGSANAPGDTASPSRPRSPHRPGCVTVADRIGRRTGTAVRARSVRRMTRLGGGPWGFGSGSACRGHRPPGLAREGKPRQASLQSPSPSAIRPGRPGFGIGIRTCRWLFGAVATTRPLERVPG